MLQIVPYLFYLQLKRRLNRMFLSPFGKKEKKKKAWMSRLHLHAEVIEILDGAVKKKRCGQ